MPEVSIVANFYKSGKYIPTLVKSVANQTFKDWELICIDDCSPENDSEIIAKVADKYGIADKVRIIRNPINLGISQAKEAGILAATGKYITFIDGDDWFPNNAIKDLHDTIAKHDADVVIANAYRHYNFSGIKRDVPMVAKIEHDDLNRVLDKDEFYDKYFINFFGVNVFNPAYWGKIYNTDFIKKLDFKYPDKMETAAEDHKFTLQVCMQAKSIVFIDKFVYYWRWGGISSFKSVKEWSPYNFLRICQDYYIDRKVLTDSFFEKGFKYLLIELKNTFKAAFTKIAAEDRAKQDVSETLQLIGKCLSHPAYDDIPKLLDINAAYGEDPIIMHMINRNIEGIYDECHKIYKSNWKRRTLRRLLGAISIA